MKNYRVNVIYCNARSCGKLTLSLRPSDMTRGQSMVNYTFLFLKFILPEFVSYVHDVGEIGVLCVRNG